MKKIMLLCCCAMIWKGNGIMTGYEFTRFDADFTNKVKARGYDVNIVKFKIEYNNKYDLRKDEKYIDAKDWFIDSTMSCDLKEAMNWMKYYMSNAIAYGIQTKDLDWKYFFLAAYDIFENLNK